MAFPTILILIEKIISQDLEVGKDVGVISYNETSLKKFILNGLTTISTDFEMRGEKAAELILNESQEHIGSEVLFDAEEFVVSYR